MPGSATISSAAASACSNPSSLHKRKILRYHWLEWQQGAHAIAARPSADRGNLIGTRCQPVWSSSGLRSRYRMMAPILDGQHRRAQLAKHRIDHRPERANEWRVNAPGGDRSRRR